MKYVFFKPTQVILLITFLLLNFTYIPFTYNKVMIFTYAYNRPDFIVLQHKTFAKFLQDEHEFIVFNDAVTDLDYQLIKDTCHSLGITCIDIPQELHDMPYLQRPTEGQYAPYHQPSVRNSNVVQYSLDALGFNHDDILILIDSDMFLIQKFSAKQFMQGYDLAGFYKHQSEFFGKELPFGYLWIGLIFLDTRSLPLKNTLNFNCGAIGNAMVDAGGFTYHHLSQATISKNRYIDRVCLRDLICKQCLSTKKMLCNHNNELLKEHGFNDDLILFTQKMPMLHGKNIHRNTEFFLNHTFLHYRAGSNYNNVSQSYNNQKTNIFNDFFNKLLND